MFGVVSVECCVCGMHPCSLTVCIDVFRGVLL